jgi:hypothetical protein
VLISVDLQDISTHGRAKDEEKSPDQSDYIISASRLFIAVDDNNYEGSSLSENWVKKSDDLHSVITAQAGEVAGFQQAVDFEGTPIGPMPQYAVSGMTVACDTTYTGIPSTDEFRKNILQVEMAELFVWFGKTLDTGIEKNRRAFIKDGKPVNPNKKPATDDPDGGCIELMGVPDIILHGSNRWKNGDGGDYASFVSTGEIKVWRPDPPKEPPT